MTATFPSTDRGIDARSAEILFHDAHTAYAFTNEPVLDEQLASIYDYVKHAPTAMNTQPLRITYVRTAAAKARLMPHIAQGNRAKAESAPVVAILAADTDFHEHLPALLPHRPGAKDLFADDTARTKAAMFNATLQAGYFILGVRAVGLDAGPMGGVDMVGIDREFFAGTALKTFLVVNIGYVAEDGTFPRSPRLDAADAITLL